MKQQKLDEILRKHNKYLEGSEEGERADLSGADLSGAVLIGADLNRADLSGANLSGADLRGADLNRADLSGTDLSGADLSGANLRHAELSGADLIGADLYRADLSGANLRHADLRGADLDYSCFPLWCGGTDFTCDERLVLQLLAHVSTLHFETENIELLEALKLVRKVSIFSHRASDLGLKR